MLKKDKALLIITWIITTGLISYLVTTFTIEVKYGRYARGAYENSIEAIEAVRQLDSTIIIN